MTWLIDVEHADTFRFAKATAQTREETGNYYDGSLDDVNLFGYFQNQFSWGKHMISYYRHPNDDFKCLLATKNILGR